MTAVDWYQAGVLHGVEIGRRQLEEEIAATQRAAMERGLQALAAREAGVKLPGVAR